MKLALSSLLALALSGALLSGCGDNAGTPAGSGATGSSSDQTKRDRSATTPRTPGGPGGAAGSSSGSTK